MLYHDVHKPNRNLFLPLLLRAGDRELGLAFDLSSYSGLYFAGQCLE
jgi:hypothetical protein